MLLSASFLSVCHFQGCTPYPCDVWMIAHSSLMQRAAEKQHTWSCDQYQPLSNSHINACPHVQRTCRMTGKGLWAGTNKAACGTATAEVSTIEPQPLGAAACLFFTWFWVDHFNTKF